MTTTVEDIPSELVGEKVQQLVETGAQEIVCTKQDDDLWTITASA